MSKDDVTGGEKVEAGDSGEREMEEAADTNLPREETRS